MERQGNFFSRLRQTKVINEKRFIQERGIHACPVLTRWSTTISRSPRICPWEICPMGHRYIVIQGAHVDVVYGKWPGEAGSRSRQKGCLPQPLRAVAQAPQHLAPTSCCASTRKYIQCRQFVYRKRPFSVVRFATTQQHDRFGRKSSKLC